MFLTLFLKVPRDCPEDFGNLMKKCWHAKAEKRPNMESILSQLEFMAGPQESVTANMEL